MDNYNSNKLNIELNSIYNMENNFFFDNEIRKYFSNFSLDKHQSCKTPDEAFLYFPKEKEIFTKDEISESKINRKIFGVKNMNTLEIEFLNKFEKYIENYNELNQKTPIEFFDGWERWDTLRFLHAANFDLKKSFQTLKDYLDWKISYFPFNISDKCIEILGFSGVLYCHGRDHCFRPNVFFKVELYVKNQKKFDFDDYQMAIIYLFEYIIANMLISGQIEQWNLFIDFDNVTFNSVPEDAHKIIKFLQTNYTCRLNIAFVLGVIKSNENLYKSFTLLLEEKTKNKFITISNCKEAKEEIFKYMNKDQIESKYGGMASDLYTKCSELEKNISQIINKSTSNSSMDNSNEEIPELNYMLFFPPIMPSKNYKAPRFFLNSPIVKSSDKGIGTPKSTLSHQNSLVNNLNLTNSPLMKSSGEKKNTFIYNPNNYDSVQLSALNIAKETQADQENKINKKENGQIANKESSDIIKLQDKKIEKPKIFIGSNNQGNLIEKIIEKDEEYDSSIYEDAMSSVTYKSADALNNGDNNSYIQIRGSIRRNSSNFYTARDLNEVTSNSINFSDKSSRMNVESILKRKSSKRVLENEEKLLEKIDTFKSLSENEKNLNANKENNNTNNNSQKEINSSKSNDFSNSKSNSNNTTKMNLKNEIENLKINKNININVSESMEDNKIIEVYQMYIEKESSHKNPENIKKSENKPIDNNFFQIDKIESNYKITNSTNGEDELKSIDISNLNENFINVKEKNINSYKLSTIIEDNEILNHLSIISKNNSQENHDYVSEKLERNSNDVISFNFFRKNTYDKESNKPSDGKHELNTNNFFEKSIENKPESISNNINININNNININFNLNNYNNQNNSTNNKNNEKDCNNLFSNKLNNSMSNEKSINVHMNINNDEFKSLTDRNKVSGQNNNTNKIFFDKKKSVSEKIDCQKGQKNILLDKKKDISPKQEKHDMNFHFNKTNEIIESEKIETNLEKNNCIDLSNSSSSKVKSRTAYNSNLVINEMNEEKKFDEIVEKMKKNINLDKDDEKSILYIKKSKTLLKNSFIDTIDCNNEGNDSFEKRDDSKASRKKIKIIKSNSFNQMKFKNNLRSDNSGNILEIIKEHEILDLKLNKNQEIENVILARNNKTTCGTNSNDNLNEEFLNITNLNNKNLFDSKTHQNTQSSKEDILNSTFNHINLINNNEASKESSVKYQSKISNKNGNNGSNFEIISINKEEISNSNFEMGNIYINSKNTDVNFTDKEKNKFNSEIEKPINSNIKQGDFPNNKNLDISHEDILNKGNTLQSLGIVDPIQPLTSRENEISVEKEINKHFLIKRLEKIKLSGIKNPQTIIITENLTKQLKKNKQCENSIKFYNLKLNSENKNSNNKNIISNTCIDKNLNNFNNLNSNNLSDHSSFKSYENQNFNKMDDITINDPMINIIKNEEDTQNKYAVKEITEKLINANHQGELNIDRFEILNSDHLEENQASIKFTKQNTEIFQNNPIDQDSDLIEENDEINENIDPNDSVINKMNKDYQLSKNKNEKDSFYIESNYKFSFNIKNNCSDRNINSIIKMNFNTENSGIKKTNTFKPSFNQNLELKTKEKGQNLLNESRNSYFKIGKNHTFSDNIKKTKENENFDMNSNNKRYQVCGLSNFQDVSINSMPIPEETENGENQNKTIHNNFKYNPLHNNRNLNTDNFINPDIHVENSIKQPCCTNVKIKDECNIY